MTGNIINRAEAALTGKTVLKKLGIRKSEMPALISKTGWKKNMLNCLGESRFKAADILKAVKPLMNEFAEVPAKCQEPDFTPKTLLLTRNMKTKKRR